VYNSPDFYLEFSLALLGFIIKKYDNNKFSAIKKVCGRRFPTLRMEKEYNTHFTEKSVAKAKSPSDFPIFPNFFTALKKFPLWSLWVASNFEGNFIEVKKLVKYCTLYAIKF